MTQNDVVHPFFSKDGKENGESSPKIPPATAKPTQPIPSCRRVINVTFTPSQMVTSSSKSSIVGKVDSNMAEIEQKLSSVSLTSPPSSVVRPPLVKQHSDIQLLMDEYATDKQNAGGLVVYLLSSSWWKSWQQATVASSSSSRSSNSTIDMLPIAIDNTCLLDNKDSSTDRLDPLSTTDNDTMFALRKDVKEGVNDGDFVCVPEAAWNALLSWYGDRRPTLSFVPSHNTHFHFLCNTTLTSLTSLSLSQYDLTDWPGMVVVLLSLVYCDPQSKEKAKDKALSVIIFCLICGQRCL